MPVSRFAPAAPEEAIVHGAGAPGGIGGGDDAVDDWIAAVREHGVERVLCLLSHRQLRRYHALLDRYRQAFGQDAVAHVPIPDHEFADEATLREALAVLRAADDAGEPVVVHCLAGIGRTGHVLAAWLVAERGYDPREAVAAVRETGRSPAEATRTGDATEADLYELLESVAEPE